ncbi:hypothetical protein GCM10027347_57700 [Larkinella harenae]
MNPLSAQQRVDQLLAQSDLKGADNQFILFTAEEDRPSSSVVAAKIVANGQVISRFDVAAVGPLTLEYARERAFKLLLDNLTRLGGLLALCRFHDSLATDPDLSRRRGYPLHAYSARLAA